MLEVGAGKGLFLKKFLEEFSGWKCSAIEPSSNALKYFKQVLPEVIFILVHSEPPSLDQGTSRLSSGVIEHFQALEFLNF